MAIKHSIKNFKHFLFALVFDGRCFVRLDSRVSNMFDAGAERVRLLSGLYEIVLACIDMLGHQTFPVCPGPKNIFATARCVKLVAKFELVL